MSPDGAPVAVVTGGTGAIGSSVCRRLAERGFNIAATYTSRSQTAVEVMRHTESTGQSALIEVVDLRQSAAVSRFLERTTDELGNPAVVVHAAGPYVPQIHVSRLVPGLFESHLNDELIAFYHLVAAALPALRSTSGSLVAVTSFAVRSITARDVLSAAPKAGIEALVNTVAVEEGRFGVRANYVAPGVLSDGIGASLAASQVFDTATLNHIRSEIPVRRLGRADEVAAVVPFLVSSDASYVTAQCIDVDGGLGA